MTTATNTVARIAAGVAGLGLVAMSFAPLAASAQTATTATTTTTTTTTATFTRDLTIGSTGADVTALQTWLIAKGFSIPAGATGYFGAQTKAALAAYQAANMITPAAGYFGPITRAKVMATTGTTTGTTTGGTTTTTTTTTLKGGEADLRNYDLLAEDGEGAEGETEVEAATAEFDVEGGDVEVQRAELTLNANDDSLGERPWDYIDNVSVWANGKKLGDMDTNSRDDWDDEDTDTSVFGSSGSDKQYTVSLDDLDYVVQDGDTADLTFAFDVNDNIDTADLDQVFSMAVLDDGIRAIDAAGIQQYTGDDNDNVDFSFSSEENGDLSVRESSDDPDSSTLKVEDDQTSDEYTVFAFDIHNSDDADTLLNELTLDVDFSSTTVDLSNVIRRATLSIDGDDTRGDVSNTDVGSYEGSINFDDLDVQLDGDSTTHFELMVEFAAQTSTTYPNGSTISFAVDTDSIDAEGADSGDEVDTNDIGGSATSETHTLSQTGFTVEPSSVSSDVTPATNAGGDSYGSFTIKFDVTADEDQDLFIDNTAARGSSTAGVGYNILLNNTASTTVASSAVLTSSADLQSGAYRISAGDTESFTLNVTIDPALSGYYAVELSKVNYADTAAEANAGTPDATFNVDTTNQDFETDQEFIQG